MRTAPFDFFILRNSLMLSVQYAMMMMMTIWEKFHGENKSIIKQTDEKVIDYNRQNIYKVKVITTCTTVSTTVEPHILSPCVITSL